MKTSFLLFTLFTLVVQCLGQTFQKEYGDSISDNGVYFIEGKNSAFELLTFAKYNIGSNYSILTTNQAGDSLNSTIIQNEISKTEGYSTNSINQFVLVGWKDTMVSTNKFIDTLYIYKADTLGNLISTWAYPDTLYFTNVRILQTSDHGFLIAAGNWNSQSDARILFLKVDSLGGVMWKQNILSYTNSSEYAVDLLETSSNSYLAEVNQTSGGNIAGTKLMLKMGSSGNVLWTRTLTFGYTAGSYQQMLATDSSYYYIDNIATTPGSIYKTRLCRLDTNGVLHWTKTFNNINVAYSNFQFKISGGFWLCGRVEDPITLEKNIIITSLDSQCDSVSSFTFGFNQPVEIPNYFKQLKDGRIAVTGIYKPTPASLAREQNIYFAVCDTLGNIYTSIKNEPDNQEGYFVIYPNPTISHITVESSRLTINSLEIYDTKGNKVYTKNVNGISESIDLNLPSGMYFLQIICGEKRFSKSFGIN